MAQLSCLKALANGEDDRIPVAARLAASRRWLARQYVAMTAELERSRSASMLGTAPARRAGGSRRSPALARLSPPPWSQRSATGKRSRPDATWRLGSVSFPGSIRPAARNASAGSRLALMILQVASRHRSHGYRPVCAPARHQAALAGAYAGTPADQGRGRGACRPRSCAWPQAMMVHSEHFKEPAMLPAAA